MPIYISSTADQFQTNNGLLKPTLSSFSTDFDGTATPEVDTDGRLNRSLNKFTASFRQTPTLDNWPFVSAAIALGSATTRLAADPWKTVIRYNNVYVHQALGYNSSATRLQQWEIFRDVTAVNPSIILIMHMNYLGITFDVDPEANTTARWKETLLFNDPGNFDTWTMQDDTGKYYSRNVILSGSRGGLAFNWNCNDSIRNQICSRTLDDWSDFDNTGDGNCMRDYNYWIMEDTLPETEPTGNYYRAAFQEAISKNTETTYTVPYWVEAPITGTADGAGYYDLTTNHEAVFLKANRTNGSSRGITGVKQNGTSNTSIRIESAPGYTTSNGDTMCVYSKTKNGNTAYGRSALGSMTATERQDGVKAFFNKYRDLTFERFGTKVGAVHNGASNEWTTKKSGEASSAPDGWEGFWEYKHFEFCARAFGFHPDENNGFYATKPYNSFPSVEYTPDNMMKAISLAQLYLIPDADSAGGYPGVWLNAQVRNQSLAFSIDALDQTDAAYIRFYNLLSWCMNNVYPQIEFFYKRNQEDHSHPIMIDEQVVSAGYPITDRDFGTYDPTGNGGVGGTFSWDSADFGTFGYIKEFDNCCIVINLRQPDNTGVPWIPSWVSGGQSITVGTDRATLPSAGTGKKWQRLNRTTYINQDEASKFLGLGPVDFDSTANIVNDTELNDGSDCGATIDVGALEAILLLRVNS